MKANFACMLMMVMVAAMPGDAWGQSEMPAEESDESLTPRAMIDRLIAEREGEPVIVQEAKPDREPIPERVGVPSASVDLDPRIVGVRPGEPLPILRREGEFVIERTGQLLSIEDGLYWVMDFESEPSQPDLRPMIVQKCQRLASMQEALLQRGENLMFTVTGQVHTYRGVNYLLPTAISGTRSAIEVENEQAVLEESLGTEASVIKPDPPHDPVAALGPDADARDVMDALLEARDEPVERPTPMPGNTGNRRPSSPGSGGGQAPVEDENLLREGTYLVSRPGRLIRGGGNGLGSVLFAFEADGDQAAEQPMMLMPSRMLELMEDIVAESGDKTVFVISGRVHTYRSANYLLPTLMRREINLGNLAN
jgi:hypothetical protein